MKATSWFTRTYKRDLKHYLLPPLCMALSLIVILLVSILLIEGLREILALLELPFFIAMITGFAFVIGLFFQVLLGLPINEIFYRNKAHWLYYIITGGALSLLVMSQILPIQAINLNNPKDILAIGFRLLPGALQGAFSYYFNIQGNKA